MQLVVPALVVLPIVGRPQGNGRVRLQIAGLIWVPFILVAATCAWFFMDNLTTASTFADQGVIVRRAHSWVMSWLYLEDGRFFHADGRARCAAQVRRLEHFELR